MLFPLKELVKFSGNIYEMTVATNRRAYQMLRIKDPLIEENDGKVVSLAAQQLFSKKVSYRIDQQY
ncbi:DNA-directed RNA polymerase subunit omega [Treponema parvum]|uniref:DNA-directed RNA polymerase subunit omega n=1 Tax=Treponema parvum TaxID=138851 RepID=A0A975F4A1_9SPIR|nr:DNA-directed RNA polymerase subunit omega [Treponema parvum]QTQ14151.1 DNA-directed RNA polymerase subunit omega [Treponema parvum]QTQ16372.1 DNA-directed RNA polymerase subunit omega [Treponema parvum]